MSATPVLRAAVLAGLVGAVVTGTPVVGALNYCCCAVVVAVGAFAAWIVRSDSAGRASTARCATAGMLAGVVAAVLGVPLAALLSRLAYGPARLQAQVSEMLEAVRRSFEDAGQPVPPGMLEGIEAGLRAGSGLDLNGWIFVTMIVSCAVYALFGMLGGFFGALVTRRNDVEPGPPPLGRPAVPAAPAVTPPAPPVAQAAPSAPPVVDSDGEPDVRWDGPVLGPGDEPSFGQASARPSPPSPDDAEGDDDRPEAGDQPVGEPVQRGEIPLDELPVLPPRPPAPGDDTQRQA